MTVAQVFVDEETQNINTLNQAGFNHKLIAYGILCNDTKVQRGIEFNSDWDPTEVAVICWFGN